MSILTKEQRNQLERVILNAREVAEAAADKALHTLGVGDPDALSFATTEQRMLRRALRAQARQLGDSEDTARKGYYNLHHLIEKIGYDQWHRMLFARFLAENNLLISPQHGVFISLKDCQELAPELGLQNRWEVAAGFASKMLPQIFRAEDSAGKIRFAPEDLNALERLLAELPVDIFLADDALGWVYQFWQSKRKDEVNNSGNKIGSDELAPVTQLFTEDYMVQFLLHNTLGAWWAGKNMPHDGIIAYTEEDARKAVSLPGINWEYLRFFQDEQTKRWKPAAGIFPGWPGKAKEITILDPCMGSGHFLVAELSLMVAIRMKEEGLSVSKAVNSVLNDNLFGLEIDARCTQIAAFNLALAGWKVGGYQTLPQLNLACSGLGIYSSRESWLKLANGNDNLRWGIDRLYDLFKNAPILGSLIDPAKIPGAGFNVNFCELQPLLVKALTKEEIKKDDDFQEMGITAEGIVKAADILTRKYTLVATNVPYLGRGKQDEILMDYCETFYPSSKNDLANVFLDRCFELTAINGSVTIVLPKLWLSLIGFKSHRKKIKANKKIDFIASLGAKAFRCISGEVVNIILFLASNATNNANSTFATIILDSEKSIERKDSCLKHNSLNVIRNTDLDDAPDSMILLESVDFESLFQNYVDTTQGLGRGDLERFDRFFWELEKVDHEIWSFIINSPLRQGFFEGREKVFKWEKGVGSLSTFDSARIQGLSSWGKQGIALSRSQDLRATLTYGYPHAENCVAITIKNTTQLEIPLIWSFCESEYFKQTVKKLNDKVIIPTGIVGKVNFKKDYWANYAMETFPNGLPKPYTESPSQWIFHGNPLYSDYPLQVALLRLLGYNWPAEYDLEMELSNNSRDLISSCSKLTSSSDFDGIICLHASNNKASAAESLRGLLADAYGDEWSNKKQSELLGQVGYASKTLEEWLREGFFEQHFKLFQHRPFIWHIWDGLKNGFNVLVNYHKLNRTNLEKLTYTYLGDWITRQKAAVESGEEGSDARLIAATELQQKLKLILEGEQPYDIFIRWKPIEQQPIGWDPDLNDGVRLNIRPFMTAGILRKNPNIKWNKDRGRDVASAPWYSIFKGERINDYHLGLSEKIKAKEQ